MHNRAGDSNGAGRDWLAALSYLALAHVVFYPVLESGVFLYGTDTVFHDYPLLFVHWSHLLNRGEIPLWNPYLFCGLPSLGTFAFCPFYPTMWLFAVLPMPVAFSYQYILNDFLAGLWTYWAARWMGLRRAGAFFAGLVFLVSGHLVTLAHAGHLQKFAAIAWAPFVLGCATAAMRSGRWGYWVACGVGLALQLLASHVQIAYYTLLCLVPWTLWLALFGRREVGSGRREAGGGSQDARGGWPGAGREGQEAGSESRMARGRNEESEAGRENISAATVNQESKIQYPKSKMATFGVAGLGLALLFGFALSAAQILPAIETTPISNRGGGVPFATAAETSYPPFEFIEFVLPGFLGDNAVGGGHVYRGQWGTERIVTDYMGLVPMLLFFFGLAASRDRNRWFWLGVIVVAAFLAAGRFTPVYEFAYEWLPGLNRFRSPATILVFMTWSAAIVAARGLEAFVERVRDDEGRWGYLLVLLFAVPAFGICALLLAAPELDWPVLRSLDLPLVRKPQSSAATVFASLQRTTLFAALACAALAVLAATETRWLRDRTVPRVLALGALFVLAFVDPRAHESRYIKAAAVRPFQLFLLDHWSDSVTKKLPPPVRGIETGNERSNRMIARGIATLHGYHPVHLQAYLDLLDLYAQNHAQLGRLVFEQFVLTPEKHSPGPEYRRVAADRGAVLWLREPPPLYAYFPDEVEAVADRETLLSRMAADDFHPYRRSLTLDPALAWSANETSTATARVITHTPNRIELAVAASAERLLVVAELTAPGWECILDSGRRIRLSTVNYAFRAMRVPSGNHRITLAYRPFSFRLGLYLTLVAVLLLIGLLVAGIRLFRVKGRG